MRETSHRLDGLGYLGGTHAYKPPASRKASIASAVVSKGCCAITLSISVRPLRGHARGCDGGVVSILQPDHRRHSLTHERLQCFYAKMLRHRFAIKVFPVLLRNVRNPHFADALRLGGGNQYFAQFVVAFLEFSDPLANIA